MIVWEKLGVTTAFGNVDVCGWTKKLVRQYIGCLLALEHEAV
jgi:hypothetical protein